MVVGQNRTAYDRKIRIGSQEIMGEQLDEIEELHEGGSLDLHGHMLTAENDAVLVIIHIGRILEKPVCLIDFQRNDPVILSGRMVYPTHISHVFLAELALGITALLHQFGSRNGLGILLRFGEIDGNINISIHTGNSPANIPGNTIAANIVRVLGKLIVIICGLFRRLFVKLPEFSGDLGRSRQKTVHQSGVKKITVNGAVLLEDSCLCRIIQQIFQDIFQFFCPDFFSGLVIFLVILFAKDLQKLVSGVNLFFL